MKFIKNYKDWIPPGLIESLDSHPGDSIPIWNEEKLSSHPELYKYRELARPGYSNGTQAYQRFTRLTDGCKEFNLQLPDFPEKRKDSFWWVVKLNPGQMQFLHVDHYLYGAVNTVRYSMFLKDWEPGHIFVYDDKILTNYKAGDVYEWDDNMVEHGVVNIGFTNRYTIQIALYDDMYWPPTL